MIPKSLYSNIDSLRDYCVALGADTGDLDDPDLLLTTFIHKTYAADFPHNKKVPHNERLEFLGDSILWAHVASLLYAKFPNHPESQLTLSKIHLVNEKTLAVVARSINLWDRIILWNWEKKSWGAKKDAILADGFEALIGYFYLVWWDNLARKLIQEHVFPLLDKNILPTKSYKSKLQEYCQKNRHILPEYLLEEKEIAESWNVLLYEATVSVQWKAVWIWTWPSKKKAQEAWAKNAFDALTK